MGYNNKISWSTYVTPKIQMDNISEVTVARDVLNENIRRSLGGDGLITASDGDYIINTGSTSASNGVSNAGTAEGLSGWWDGDYYYVTSNATTIICSGKDMVVIKNSGFEYDLHSGPLTDHNKNISTTAGTPGTDMVKIGIQGSTTIGVTGDGVLLAELDVGESIAIPRPASDYTLLLTSSSSHMAFEVTTLGTTGGGPSYPDSEDVGD